MVGMKPYYLKDAAVSEAPMQSRFAWVSLILGIVALPLYPVFAAGWLYFGDFGKWVFHAEQSPQGVEAMGNALVDCIIVNVAGVVLGIAGRMQKERKQGLAITAMWLNGLPLLFLLVVVGIMIYQR